MTTSMSFRCVVAKSLLSSVGILFLLGGCAWSPFGLDKDKADAGALMQQQNVSIVR
jgi:hypothetical protein